MKSSGVLFGEGEGRNRTPRHEDVWESRGIASRILNLGARGG
jgi:hypothetical protein